MLEKLKSAGLLRSTTSMNLSRVCGRGSSLLSRGACIAEAGRLVLLPDTMINYDFSRPQVNFQIHLPVYVRRVTASDIGALKQLRAGRRLERKEASVSQEDSDNPPHQQRQPRGD